MKSTAATASAAALLTLFLGYANMPPAAAADIDPNSVEYLLSQCSATSAIEVAGCRNYIAGVADMVGFTHEVMKMENLESAVLTTYCPGEEGLSYGAMSQAFVNWAKKHPETWQKPKFGGAIDALVETWPCR
ncbi:hypothetical protein NKI12_28575 [Mesorhizobium australicum]|uniref:Uncharacterized protein n=1 Tax=Mesorhizobium australicum TaxID=536018 RepID=A0ACC6T7Q8_9HYPH